VSEEATTGVRAVPADARLARLSGEFLEPEAETAYRQDQVLTHLRIYGQVALLIAVAFSGFWVLDVASLGLGVEAAVLLVARLTASGVVLCTRRSLLRRPERFATSAGLDRIAATQVLLYAVVLLVCALRPQDAATNALSVAVMVLGAMVVLPGRFGVQVGIGTAMVGAFAAVTELVADEPPFAAAPLMANLLVAVVWGATILRLTNRDGRRRWAAVRTAAAAAEQLQDELAASDRLRAELQLLARQDPLTSAANRRELVRATESALEDPGAGTSSLLLFDADRFKAINDRFGHAAGDAALVAMVRATRAAVRADDLVARLGGEEFAVLLPGMDAATATETAERVRRAIHSARVPGHDELRLSVSVGVATSSPGDSVDGLLARADAAMYTAKRRGGDGVHPADDGASAAS
jgi:diguanylate cyclase (GGDEF)-like protein